METFTPVTLKQKSPLELFQMRNRIIADLHANADAYEGRAPSAQEKAFEERAESNVKTLDKVLEEQLREASVNAAFAKYNGVGPRLTSRDMEAVDWVKSAIVDKNPAHFDIRPEEERAFSVSQPGLEYRSLWEQRDTLKTTASQALPVSVWPNFLIHLVEMTPVIRAGATVITTSTGEDLLYPKTTAFQTGNLINEGASITESDPTLAVNTFKSYGFKAFWQLSRELVEDSSANILDTLTQTAATALALSYGAKLATGTVGIEPGGYMSMSSVGVTGPTGTNGQFGTQGTAGMGTDLILDLYASVQEPYLLSPSVAILGRNATFNILRKYKEGGTNSPMLDMAPRKAGASYDLLGQAAYVDPHVAAAGSSTKSLGFGDFSRYVVRIVNGVRVERSDEFAFQNDLVSFKAVIRLDGQLVDTNAIKTFQHSST